MRFSQSSPSAEEPATSVGTRSHPTRGSGLPHAVFTMKALQDLADRIQRTDSLESLVDAILAGLEESFGFRNSMILVPAEEAGVLVTIATRGYQQNGSGAEARIGEGIVGLVAEARKPIRISGLMRGMLYAYTIRQQQPGGPGSRHAERRRVCRCPTATQPPRATFRNYLLMVRGEFVGMLYVESDSPIHFHGGGESILDRPALATISPSPFRNMQFTRERQTDTVEFLGGTIARSDLRCCSSPDTRRVPTPPIVYHCATRMPS